MAIGLWRISRTFLKHRHIEFVFLPIDIGYYHAEKVGILLWNPVSKMSAWERAGIRYNVCLNVSKCFIVVGVHLKFIRQFSCWERKLTVKDDYVQGSPKCMTISLKSSERLALRGSERNHVAVLLEYYVWKRRPLHIRRQATLVSIWNTLFVSAGDEEKSR